MQKKLALIILLLMHMLNVCAQNLRQNARYLEYIEKYRDIAVEQMKEHRIPASITMAQALLESGAGQSELTRKANNHFGIKCGNDWVGPTSHHDDDALQECFRAYKNARESYEDHSFFLTSKRRYASLFNLKITDYKGWARGLKAAGYATSPVYADNLIRIIETYELYKLDSETGSKKKTTTQPQSSQRVIYKNNKNYYVLAKRGDTFRSLGKELDISYRKLARYNERDKKDVLSEGDVIYLEKKKAKADKKYKGVLHVVQPGESMYSIAQRYAIRLKSLYKMNNLSADYVIRTGDKLKIR
ncbi:MAG: glucosaminidase domain-containing protein [Prevotellaceae bacterium]|nr:glucosaminidase domain-containing protein [Prevotellaceae bacterium]